MPISGSLALDELHYINKLALIFTVLDYNCVILGQCEKIKHGSHQIRFSNSQYTVFNVYTATLSDKNFTTNVLTKSIQNALSTENKWNKVFKYKEL